MKQLILTLLIISAAILGCTKEEDPDPATVTVYGTKSTFISVRLNGTEKARIIPLRQDTPEQIVIDCRKKDWPVISAYRDTDTGRINLVVDYHGQRFTATDTGYQGISTFVQLRQP